MLISQTLNDKINEQIGYEFAASIQYTAIASHFDAESLPFLARHFYKQADEEHEHAMKFIKFLIDAGARVEIPAVSKPVALSCGALSVNERERLNYQLSTINFLNEPSNLRDYNSRRRGHPYTERRENHPRNRD